MNQAVFINPKALSPAERQKYDEGWRLNAFNLYASNKIPLHRPMPDIRNDEWVREAFTDGYRNLMSSRLLLGVTNKLPC